MPPNITTANTNHRAEAKTACQARPCSIDVAGQGRLSNSAVNASPASLLAGLQQHRHEGEARVQWPQLAQLDTSGADNDQDAAPTDATRLREAAAYRVAPQPSFKRHGLIGGTMSFTISAITSSSCPTQVCPPWSNPTNFAIGIRLAVYFAVAYVPY